jgi:hypothetical protein
MRRKYGEKALIRDQHGTVEKNRTWEVKSALLYMQKYVCVGAER